MRTPRNMFFILLASTFIGTSLPVSADSTKVSFRSWSTKNNHIIKCNFNQTTKGRNQHTNQVVKVSRGKTGSCKVTRRAKRFTNPKIGGLRIDACVRGIDWEKTDAKRCDLLRLKKIANEFCRSKGFKTSSTYTKIPHTGKHAVLTYKKSKPKNSVWKRKKGNALIKSILCE